MPLDEREKTEIAAMIGRGLAASMAMRSLQSPLGPFLDTDAVEEAAQNPEGHTIAGDRMMIWTKLPPEGHSTLSDGTSTTVYVFGLLDGQDGSAVFSFPPNDEALLPELKRIQCSPHLLAQSWAIVFSQEDTGHRIIEKVGTGWNPPG